MSDADATDSDDDDFGTPVFEVPPDLLTSEGGDIPTTPPERPEAEKPAKRAARLTASRSSRDKDSGPREAKAGPPTLVEWECFFSKIVLRLITEYYITLAFRGIDEDMLTDRDVERLAMTDDERQTIAVPFAELSNKSRFMRKHGRMIVASGDAFNAAVVLGMWMARVNRIANKYKPKQAKAKAKVTIHGSDGQAAANGSYAEGANGGRIFSDFPIFPSSG